MHASVENAMRDLRSAFPLRERVRGLVHGTNSLPKPSPQAGERKFAVPLCKN